MAASGHPASVLPAPCCVPIVVGGQGLPVWRPQLCRPPCTYLLTLLGTAAVGQALVSVCLHCYSFWFFSGAKLHGIFWSAGWEHPSVLAARPAHISLVFILSKLQPCGMQFRLRQGYSLWRLQSCCAYPRDLTLVKFLGWFLLHENFPLVPE